MEQTIIQKYSDTEVKEIKTIETIVPVSDYQNQLDAKQKSLDDANQALTDEITRTTARQDEIKTLIASLTDDLNEISTKITKAQEVGVVDAGEGVIE